MEAELAKLMQDDNDEDYLKEKLDRLQVHDSALGSDEDEARKSSQKKGRLTS